MTEYLLIVKTVDGETHKVETQDDSPELASLWLRNTNSDIWFGYEEGTSFKYINKTKVVSIDVVDVVAEEEAKQKSKNESQEAWKHLNVGK